MPNRIVLPALSLRLTIVCLAHSAASAGMKPVASVALPCESYFQVISPAGDQVASRCGDHTLRLVNVRSGTTRHTFDPKMRIAQYNDSRAGHWFAVGLRDGTVEVVPTSGTAEAKRSKSATRAIDTLEFLPDSSGILVGPQDPAGQIWDLHASRRQLSTRHSDFAGLLACSFSPDGKLLVTVDSDTVVRF